MDNKNETLIINLRKLYEQYGYKKISLPTFEEYDLYSEYRDFIKSEKILTLMTPEGKLEALRPDITLSVAKKVAKDKNIKSEKVYYVENIYRFSKMNGYKEKRQLGIELIGTETEFLNYEITNLALKSLQEINQNYILAFSHVGFISSIFNNIQIDYDLQNEILHNIQHKNTHDLEKLQSFDLDSSLKEILEQLHSFYKLLLLSSENDKERIILDLSLANNLEYYNGIIFQGYVEGLSKIILTGGRYDNLFEKFGIHKGAIGFAIYLDNLKGYFKEIKKNDVDILLLYDNSNYELLISAINELITKGFSVRAEEISNTTIISNLNYNELYTFKNSKLELSTKGVE
jgi:ATP phosphoribosyltransferase regulatory subunit